MKHKIIRSGRNSLSVIIPAKFIHALGVKAGDTVKVETHIDTGVVRLFFSGAKQLHLTMSEGSRRKQKISSRKGSKK